MRNKLKIYVGRTKSALVLKYPAGKFDSGYCRFFSADEELSKTAYYLKLEFKNREVEFLPLIDEYENRGIEPSESGELEKLSDAYQETKLN
jgi:hypothetical protein